MSGPLPVNRRRIHRLIQNLTALTAAVLLAPAAAATDTSCVAIYDVRSGTTWKSDPDACGKRFSPASTFKIPHALIALQTGAIRPNDIEQWDGTRFPNQAAWEQNHTLQSAITHSVVWFFQRTAPRIGADQMRESLRRFEYGNAGTSGDPAMYWLNGTLQISVEEQLAFLRKFFAGELPVRGEYVDMVREFLLQEPGTVQNATGRHRMSVSWSHPLEVLAKTGATRTPDGNGVSWLMGGIRSPNGMVHLFACGVNRTAPVDSLEAARVAFATLASRGLL